MRSFFKNPIFLPGRPILFITAAVSLLAISVIQVNCPVCSSVVTDSSENSLKVLEVKGELVDLRVDHDWCHGKFMTATYNVDISVANEGPKSLSVPLLLKGAIFQTYKGHEGMIRENAKLLYVEVPGKETKQIQEVIKIAIVSGVPWKLVNFQEIELSVITDPDEIRANCHICDGKGKVPFTDWLKGIIQ